MRRGAVGALISESWGLSAPASGLVSSRAYRGAAVTFHRPPSRAWEWRRSPDSAMTVVIFAHDGTMSCPDVPKSDRLLLSDSHSTTVDWHQSPSLALVWLPTQAVFEAGIPQTTGPLPITRSPISDGFDAFVTALGTQGDASGSVTSYVVERLLVEMALGTLLESVGRGPIEESEERGIQHARRLLLLHRADPDYGVDRLAADMHMSPRNLQRLFAAHGSAPAAELRSLRVELARSLRHGDDSRSLSTAAIAAHAGFTNAQALRRALRTSWGAADDLAGPEVTA